MRFQNVLTRVYAEPWQITPAGWYAIHQLVMSHFDELPKIEAKTEPRPEGKRPKEDIFGEPLEQMRIDGRVAIIPIKGSLVKGATLFDKSCGATSHEDIRDDIQNAVEARVKSVVFDINSPGGMVMGTPELAARVARLRSEKIQTFVYTDELICSAAYYIGAGAHEIYCTPSAMIGSIGTIWEFYNVVEQLKQRGIAYNVFTSGKFKGLGHPAQELSMEQAGWIQDHVNMLAEQFKAHVRQYRPKVEEETMQGQTFTGEQASEAGLVDGLVDSLQDVIAMAR